MTMINLTERAEKKLTPEALEIVKRHCTAIREELIALGPNVEILGNKTVAFNNDTAFRDNLFDFVGNFVFWPPGLSKCVRTHERALNHELKETLAVLTQIRDLVPMSVDFYEAAGKRIQEASSKINPESPLLPQIYLLPEESGEELLEDSGPLDEKPNEESTTPSRPSFIDAPDTIRLCEHVKTEDGNELFVEVSIKDQKDLPAAPKQDLLLAVEDFSQRAVVILSPLTKTIPQCKVLP